MSDGKILFWLFISVFLMATMVGMFVAAVVVLKAAGVA
jgi:hypothetical protein